jgi:hypothetical protein
MVYISDIKIQILHFILAKTWRRVRVEKETYPFLAHSNA